MASSKTIELPCFGITLTVRDGGGTIKSSLKELCPYCGIPDCFFHCPTSRQDRTQDAQDEVHARIKFNSIIDGIESLILAAACQGIDVATPAFLAAIETAVQAAERVFN